MKVTAIFCGRTNWKTECVAKAARTGAAEEGAEVEAINLMDLTIQPCINCCLLYTSASPSGPCIRCLTRRRRTWCPTTITAIWISWA